MKKFLIYKIKPALFLAGCFAVFYIVLIFSYPKEAAKGGLNGLLICGEIIIPSLFPFMVASLFLNKSGIMYYIGKVINPITRALFNLSGEAAAVLLMSFIAGYPVGARLTNELYKTGKITHGEASRMLCFTVNAGPAFIVTAVGLGILNSKAAGIVLLVAHVLGSVLIGIILGIISRRSEPAQNNTVKSNQKPQSLSSAFVESTADASSSILNVCAWVVLFSCITQLLNRASLPYNLGLILSSMSEVTTGVILLASTCNLPLLAALLGWAGLSVHCQVISSAKDISPNILKFTFFRIIHGALSAIFAWFIFRIYPLAISTGESNVQITSRPSSVSIPVSISLIFMSVVLLFFIGENQSPSKH